MSVESPWTCFDAILTGLEDELIATPDAEIVADAQNEEAGEVKRLVERRADRRRSQAIFVRRGTKRRIPRDPAARRALLKMLLSETPAPRLAVGFRDANRLADTDVDDLLRMLLQSGDFSDPD